jgi:hypothetical protein
MPSFKYEPAPKPKEQYTTSAEPKKKGELSAQGQSPGIHERGSRSAQPSAQEQSLRTHQPGTASAQPSALGVDQTGIAKDSLPISKGNYLPPLPYKSELQRQTFVQQEAESGLTTFFESVKSSSSESNPDPLINWSNKTLAPALLSAAFRRLVEAAAYDVSAIYKQLKVIYPDLQKGTVDKLVELLKELSQGKPLDEEALRKAIWGLLSDKQANEDLKQVFIGLKQTIKEAQAKTRIDIRGNVYGLIIGDHNVVNQTFNGFLQDKP